MSPDRDGVRNRILLKLSAAELGYVGPRLEPFQFNLHEKVIRPNTPITHVYFPDSGQLSVIAGARNAEPIEVGMVGREGTTDMVLVPGKDRSPFTYLVQMSGNGWRMSAEDYASALGRFPDMHFRAIRFLQWMMIQVSYAALSHGCYTIEERLARWLLMAHDRIDGDELPLVHQFVSMMLGVRRAGVTEAIHVLEGRKAIRATRGKITILDRAKLEEAAGGSYGVTEAEYRRLLEDSPY